MLRVAIPYGLLYPRSCARWRHCAPLRTAAYGQFSPRGKNIRTTAQAPERSPIILADLAEVRDGMPSQSSAALHPQINSTRVTWPASRSMSSKTAALVRDHPSMVDFPSRFTYLPRKSKIPVTGAPQDRAASLFMTSAVHIVARPDGEPGLRSWRRRAWGARHIIE